MLGCSIGIKGHDYNACLEWWWLGHVFGWCVGLGEDVCDTCKVIIGL